MIKVCVAFGLALLAINSTAIQAQRTAIDAGEVCLSTVLAVYSGDNIAIRCGNFDYKVKLATIDAPEVSDGTTRCYVQPHGVKSKNALSERIIGKKVTVYVGQVDSDNNLLAAIRDSEGKIDEWMVKSGLAWNAQDSTKAELRVLEKSAMKNKVGLWANPDKCTIAPWFWGRLDFNSRCDIVENATCY